MSVPNTGSTVLLRLFTNRRWYTLFWLSFWCILSYKGLWMLSSIFLNLVYPVGYFSGSTQSFILLISYGVYLAATRFTLMLVPTIHSTTATSRPLLSISCV